MVGPFGLVLSKVENFPELARIEKFALQFRNGGVDREHLGRVVIVTRKTLAALVVIAVVLAIILGMAGGMASPPGTGQATIQSPEGMAYLPFTLAAVLDTYFTHA